MTDPILERRGTPRVNVALDCRAELGVSCPAQILEISPAGILLASKTELSIGERAEFRATVGGRALRIVIEIRTVSRETRPRGGMRYRLGSAFVAMTVEQRVLLLELLGADTH